MDLLRLSPNHASSASSAERCRDIKRWTRELLALPDGATVIVSESRCTEVGCPPMEVIVAVFEPHQSHRQCRIHSTLIDVHFDHLRNAWHCAHALKDHTHD